MTLLLSELSEYKHLENFSSTEGYWSTSDCIAIAQNILEITKANSLLEIGFNIGYSAATWLNCGVQELIVIDIGIHKDTINSIKATAKHYSDKKVYWWIGNSTSEQAKNLDIDKVDMVFIDGEHSYKGCMSDSMLAIHYNADWIVYDDVIENHINGIHKVIEELKQSNKIIEVKKYPMTWESGFVVLCKVVK